MILVGGKNTVFQEGLEDSFNEHGLALGVVISPGSAVRGRVDSAKLGVDAMPLKEPVNLVHVLRLVRLLIPGDIISVLPNSSSQTAYA